MTESWQAYRTRKLAELDNENPTLAYVVPAAGRAALLNAANDAHRMAQLSVTPRHFVSEEDLDWYQAEPQRQLASDLYRPTDLALSAQLNAVGRWLRALAGGDP